MAPPPPASAAVPAPRRHAVATVMSAIPRRVGRGDAPSTRRAPLRVVPERRRRTRRGVGVAANPGRPLIVLSVSLVVAALLAVVLGQAFLANGQVRLSDLQHRLMLEQSSHRQAELELARLETPSRIVAAAQNQGHMVHATMVQLPYVSLSVPLPTPKVLPAPAPAPPPPTTSSAGAGTPAGTSSTGSTGSTAAAASSSSSSATPATTPTTTP
jgi:type II secretory pathway pseudopilin PulG